jgi:peptidoglycan/LPS O-acetylase OafA/YrhL
MVVASAGSKASLPDSGRFIALDSFRGIAALIVAAYHLHGGGPLLQSDFVQSGATAVDFFFVLSGFVIAGSYGARLAAGFSVLRFMVLRLGRIYPLHIVLLAILVAQELAQAYLAIPGASLRAPFSSGHTPGQLLLTLLLVQGLQTPITSDWSLQSWSISVELWLYVLAATSWHAFGRLAWIAALSAALVSGYLMEFRGADLSTPFSPELLRGILGFGLGIVCWTIWSSPLQPRLGAAATVFEGLVISVSACLMVTQDRLVIGQIVLDVSFAVLVLVFAGGTGWFSRQLQRKAFVLLGKISYSLYMVHPLVMARGTDVFRMFGLGTVQWDPDGGQIRVITASPLLADLLGILLLCVALAAAWISWRCIESPARAWSRRLASPMGVARSEAVAPTM